MKIKKLKKSLPEQAYDIILDKICIGEFEIGARLNQDELAKQLDISRQPVNSAISILKSNGFVEETGRRGVKVSDITLEQFHSIYEFRSAIEPLAVQLATKRKPVSAEQEAKKVLERGWAAVNSRNLTQQLQADFEFHLLIYGWTQNSSVIDSMTLNWGHIRRTMSLAVKENLSPDIFWNEHECIINSILNGNAQLAVANMKSHIEDAKCKTIDLLKNKIDLGYA